MRVELQAAIIFWGTNGLLKDVPVKEIGTFETEFLSYLENKHKDVLDGLGSGKLDDNIKSTLTSAAEELTAKYRS